MKISITIDDINVNDLMNFTVTLNATQFNELQILLKQQVASLAQLVALQQTSFAAILQHMTVDDALFQQILAAFQAALTAEAGDVTATNALAATNASLVSQLAPMDPATAATVTSLLAQALAANPPAPAAVQAAAAAVAPANPAPTA